MNSIVPPACAKPLGRWLQAGDSVADKDGGLENFVLRQRITKTDKVSKEWWITNDKNDMKVGFINRKISFVLLVVFFLLTSCINSNTKNTTTVDTFEIDLTEELEKCDVVEPNFNICRFKSQLDSLLSIVEYKNFQFQLDIDTISEQSNPTILWYFEKNGLFKIVDSKKTSQLILYHLFDPKTRKILRIYLIEASYNDSITFDKVYQTFLREKDRKKRFFIDDDANEYYINYRLTWLNDYVIVLENKIYWLNVSLQYSMKNFNAIIEYFKDNLNVKNYVDTIKCVYD